MKIFRQLINTEEIGTFLADATHEDGKIQSLTVFPVNDGIVGNKLSYTMDDLTDLVAKMQVNLTESLG